MFRVTLSILMSDHNLKVIDGLARKFHSKVLIFTIPRPGMDETSHGPIINLNRMTGLNVRTKMDLKNCEAIALRAGTF
jgi:hypothetical protein